MRTIGTMMLVGGLALVGGAQAGQGCTYDKTAAEKAGCAAKSKDHAAACAAKGVKDCAGCEALFKTRQALEAAGAKVEVARMKSGYALIATGGEGSLESIRRVNAERWVAVEATGQNGNGKKSCRDCTAFFKALHTQDVTYETVDLANGVMTVFTGATPEAVASLKESCGMICGLKAEAKIEKTTATN